MRLSILNKLFLSHFGIVLLVSGSVGTYVYTSATDSLMDSLQARLRNSAALISQGLDARGLEVIRTPEDVTTGGYRDKVRELRRLARVDPEIAFVYVMRREGERIVFVLDSDLEEPAMPGEEYPHRLPALLAGFERPSVDQQINGDRWGYFLSGYSPVFAPDAPYLVGVDMRADTVHAQFEQLRLAYVVSLVAAVPIALIVSGWVSEGFTRRIRELLRRFESLVPGAGWDASGRRGDELEGLTRTFDHLAGRLADDRRQIEGDKDRLRRARDELELRVEERTAELSMANAKLREEIQERRRVEQLLQQASLTDFLTGAPNRRAGTLRLEQFAAAQDRNRRPFSVIVMDLDTFKSINDSRGHDCGDAVLVAVVDRLRRHLRPSDELVRWGGEEFLLVLPDTTLPEAGVLAERLRAALDERAVAVGDGEVRVTASFGAAEFGDGDTVNACLKRADKALYLAKGDGRNRVVLGER